MNIPDIYTITFLMTTMKGIVLTGNTKKPMLNNLTIEPNYILESINDLI